ncbi:MAG TPA: ABC transporter ATP-binding protein [Clostridiales bacterium]|nr:ABC transporter ATP-binding protein [Clostridiales bacterium]
MTCLTKKHILEIENLSVSFLQYDKGMRQRSLPVITNLSVSVHEGEIVAVVGASGSGKSLLAHAVLGLLPANADVSGSIRFEEKLLTAADIAALRGKGITLVPQSTTYLDPLLKVGKAVRKNKKDAATLKKQRDLFRHFQLGSATENLYPFELSGGMARRVLLTAALMDDPRLIIADEPTPGLDLELAKKAMADFRAFADQGNGVLLITHDMELAFSVADRIAVFYAGTTVEEALVADFEEEATLRHPYTKALWRALPENGFTALPGNQPYVTAMPQGCPFGPRCPHFDSVCEGEIPLKTIRCGTVRCIKAADSGVV